jgi:hypothetical protein
MVLVRLGNALYWLGCVLAALIVAAAILEWFHVAQYQHNGWIIIFEFAVFAFIAWGVGHMCRYTLSRT